MARLSLLDMAFLQMESPESPAHVGGLQIFEPPKDYEGDFVQDLVEELKTGGPVVPPFNQRLKMPSSIFGGFPEWEQDPEFDLDYHVRFSALPRPGTMDQLFTLIERIHARQLDRTRPLWEAYLIEGLDDGRFVMYTKMHHSVIDGIAGMRLIAQTLSTTPETGVAKAPWQIDTRKKSDPDVAPPPAVDIIGNIVSGVRKHMKTLPEIAQNFVDLGRQMAGVEDTSLAVPFGAPQTQFNHPITAHRRFAVDSLDMAEVKALGKQMGGTINDVVLAVCAGALRRYFVEHQALPDRPLNTVVPVSFRPQDGSSGGNQISAIMVDLATHIADPVQRFYAIRKSANSAKSQVQGMSKEGKQNYAVLMNGLNVALDPLVRTGAVAPASNLVISNVPGPPVTLYLNGARLTAMYPVSVLMHGMGLNITITSYEGRLDFGLIACRKAVPDLRYMATLVSSEFKALQEAADRADLSAEMSEDNDVADKPAAE